MLWLIIISPQRDHGASCTGTTKSVYVKLYNNSSESPAALDDVETYLMSGVIRRHFTPQQLIVPVINRLLLMMATVGFLPAMVCTHLMLRDVQSCQHMDMDMY